MAMPMGVGWHMLDRADTGVVLDNDTWHDAGPLWYVCYLRK